MPIIAIKMGEYEPHILEVAKTIQHMEESTFQCHICKDTFKHPVRLRCEHTFCKLCIDRWIREKNNYENADKVDSKAYCPICNEGPVTKRSLNPDKQLSPMLDVFQELLDELEKAGKN